MQQVQNYPANSNQRFSLSNSQSNHSVGEPLESSSMIITNHIKRKYRQQDKRNISSKIFQLPEDLIVASKIKHTQKQEVKNSTPNDFKKQCRICLQDQSQGRIINPCKCTGSMSFVHQKCLAEWVKKKVDFRTKVRCQVCDEQFIYKLGKKLSLSCEQLSKNYFKQTSTYKYFIGIMIFLVLIWLSLVVLVAIASDQTNGEVIRNAFMNDDSSRIVFICVIVILLVVMVFVLLLFFAEYGIHTEVIIKNISCYGTAPIKKKQLKLYQSS